MSLYGDKGVFILRKEWSKMEPVSIQILDTPEKFRPTAEAAAQSLAALLRELAALEDKSFAQYTRLCRKGRITEFKDGVRSEFTDTQAWNGEMKVRFAALLDPHCTRKLTAQRRDCLHAESFPSGFNCLNTGCELTVTMKSAGKAVVQLIPNEDSIPFDLSDPDVRYVVEDMKSRGHIAQYYGYFQKFRFILRYEADRWKIDEVYNAADDGGRWKRDWYF